ncbi:hypothetical protein Nepgr_000337 [Nepenthes gracilis]|uniref:Uncharacterized protein n=1 Tax=Nepenthes gracilis TaxID=150966 RepID=A0AAD3P3E0_NEPGR|nr:hypothetical protein Nepgr_000337 [Nepenthes gracilis]
MSAEREDVDKPTGQRDNPPGTTVVYGGAATDGEGGESYAGSTGGSNVGPGSQRSRPVRENYDPTQRRGTTTGEYGKTGIGLMDRAKDKLADVGGFKDEPGHTTTTGTGNYGDGSGQEPEHRKK